ncbi:MAG: glutamate mutase L, partial [Eubacteriales bacterium]|nr:glutamate mutase L [Eubacteriales bacterium]
MKTQIELLLAEIGSTTTVMNAFTDLDTEDPKFLGQGQSHTTVLEGDVSIGLRLALEDLMKQLPDYTSEGAEMLATSSAAGGLRMSVHGLVYDMTVRAAREAALGSGAVVKLVTAGRLRRGDLKKIQELEPKMFFLAGGTDYGER